MKSMSSFIFEMNQAIQNANQEKINISDPVKYLLDYEGDMANKELSEKLSQAQVQFNLQQIKEVNRENLKPFIAFLATRWERIRKTPANYLANPLTFANRFCMELANKIYDSLPQKDQDYTSPVNLLIPSLSTIYKSQLTDLSRFILNDEDDSLIDVLECLKLARKENTDQLKMTDGRRLSQAEIQRIIGFSQEANDFYTLLKSSEANETAKDGCERKLQVSLRCTRDPLLTAYGKQGIKRLLHYFFPACEDLVSFLASKANNKQVIQASILSNFDVEDLSFIVLNLRTQDKDFLQKLFNHPAIKEETASLYSPKMLAILVDLSKKWLASHEDELQRLIQQLNFHFFKKKWTPIFNVEMQPVIGSKEGVCFAIKNKINSRDDLVDMLVNNSTNHWGFLLKIFNLEELSAIVFGSVCDNEKFKYHFAMIINQDDRLIKDKVKIDAIIFIYNRLYLKWLDSLNNEKESSLEKLKLHYHTQNLEKNGSVLFAAQVYKNILNDIHVHSVLINNIKANIKDENDLIITLHKLPVSCWELFINNFNRDELAKLLLGKSPDLNEFDHLYKNKIQTIDANEAMIFLFNQLYLAWRPHQGTKKTHFLFVGVGDNKEDKLEASRLINSFIMSELPLSQFDKFYKNYLSIKKINPIRQAVLDSALSKEGNGVLNSLVKKIYERSEGTISSLKPTALGT